VRADDAAKILLVRAIEETLPAIAVSPAADAAADALDAEGETAWVLRRAVHRLDHDLAAYRPLLWIAETPAVPALALLLPFLLGVLSNWLGPVSQIHVLYNPIAVLVAWNLGLYAALVVAPLVQRARRMPRAAAEAATPQAPTPSTPPIHARHGARGWLLRRALPAWTSLALRLRRSAHDAAASATRAGAIARRFAALWIDAAGGVTSASLRRLLHASAAALAVGAVAGMFVRGVFFEYAMVWRSTFVRDPETVASLLRGVLGPAAALLGRPLPSVADAEALMSAAGVPAAEWIGLWAATAALFVVAPRVVLAGVSALQRRARARRVAIAPADAYYEQLLAGVRKVQIERIQAAISDDVRAETAKLVDAVADFVCAHLYDGRLVPQLAAFRDAGGSVEQLETEMALACESFQPELDAELERARGAFETALRAAIERTLGRDFGFADSRVAVDASGLPTQIGGAVGREISNAVGASVSAAVSLVVATLSGGFGHHLGAAILVTLLHTTGPVGFVIGGIGGLAVAAAGWYLGRERIAQSMRGVGLPKSIARLVLRERAMQKLVAQGREQCRASVRERLGAELDPLVPRLAEEIWTKLRPVLAAGAPALRAKGAAS
jgi:hypothetical protein